MNFKMTSTVLVSLTLLTAILWPGRTCAADFMADIKGDTETLSATPSRLLGSPGHEEAKKRLAAKIENMAGVKLVRQPFPVMIPSIRKAEMIVRNGELEGSHRIYPVWPDNVRLKSTPAEGISGKVIYIGEGDYGKIPATSLRGNIAAMEMSAYSEQTWLRAFEFGAAAVILLGSEDDTADQPLYASIYKPRYYVPDGPLADALRADQLDQITIHCDAAWTTATAENLLAMVPGTDPTARPIVLTASYDAMSVIPGLAPGADNAVDAAFLMRTLTYLSEHPPKRGVVVAFVDAFGINLMGMRELMVLLNVTPADSTRQKYQEEINDLISEYEEVKKQVDELGADPFKALPEIQDKARYRTLQRYVKDVLSPEIISLRENLFELRLAEGDLDREYRKLKGEQEELEGEEAEQKGEEARLKKIELDKVTQLKLEKIEQKGQLDAILSGIVSTGTIPKGLEEECAAVWETIRFRTAKQLEEISSKATFFEQYDDLRAEVLEGLDIADADSADVLFPFVFGVDLSDSGITVGPSFKCGLLFGDYSAEGRKFVRWLKEIIQDSDNPYARIPSDRLAALGLRGESIQPLVDQFLNAEAVDTPQLKDVLEDNFPGISDKTIRRIKGAIDSELEAEGKLMDTALYEILREELPDMGGTDIEKLVINILNQEAIGGRVDPSTTAVQSKALITGAVSSFQATGVTWTTLEGFSSRLDTPQDKFERLDWERLEPQIMITALLIEMMLNDDDFVPEDNKAREGTYPKWHMPSGKAVSESVAETIARTPEPGMMITSFNDKKGPAVVGMRGHEFIKTRIDGRFRFRPKPADCWWPARNRFVKAYSLDEHGKITHAIATVTSMLTTNEPGRFTMAHNPPLAPVRAEIFECVAVNGPVFRDPRYQTPLNGGNVIDVGRGGVPKKYFWSATAGPMFGLLKPETRYQLILGLGGGKNRMALLNVPEDLNETDLNLQKALKHGFSASKPLPALPELISAQDFFRIDEWRLRRLESAGVVVEAIRDIHEDTRKWLAKADEAYAADQGSEHKRAATLALANEIRAYQAVQDQANDVTRGAIFLLLLIVPFAVAMERLLFASPEIGKQISKSIGIFMVMFLILISFHPGFKITAMPAVILIAFMVLLLSVSVINMILRKFRADMEEIRRGTLAEASGAQTGRRGVMMSAIWLGIANMRKRFVRTLLTGLTIVLVTFSLLCFTSSSTYQNKRTTTLEGVEQTHSGVLLQHPMNQALDDQTRESVDNMLGGENLVIGRYWSVNTETPEWRIHVRHSDTGQLAPLKAGLGLDPREDRFSNITAVLNDWESFAEGDGCYVSEPVAARLGAKAGDDIVVAGTALKLIATFDGRAFEAQVRKLDGQPLLPLDYTVQKGSGQMDQEAMEQNMADNAAMMIEPDPTLAHVSADEMIILPIPLSRKLNGQLQNIVITNKNDDPKALANQMVQNIVYPIYYGAENGVKAIVSTPLLPKAPRKLLIPILIASLIIFNTMLNSIAERKKEIYIYSSLGLAPQHIGILFLGEALTYGLMGSVFGYIFGQGLATVLTKFNLMGGITLNYSGSNVIMTMGLVIMVVAVSAIVPAIMAAKIASPSGDLDWKVPHPEGGIIRGDLPFTVSQQAAPGLAAFLYDYLAAHKDGAIGSFTSDRIRLEEGEGNKVINLKSTIWPAPYDLGVRQDMTISFEASEGDICDLRIQLEHKAGQERSWWRLNKVFLGNIRSQLLGWRNVAPQRMLNYIRQANSQKQ